MSLGLIDFLRNWGESLFTSKKAYIAQQSLPNTRESVITVPSDSTEHTTVSPIDGWACMNSKDGNVENFQLFTNKIHSLMALSERFWFRGFIPVKKGDVVAYRCSGSSSAGATLSFIRSIGGGAKSLLALAVRCVRGGGLCLRHFSNHCSRFLLKSLKLRGLAHKRFHDQATEFRWSVHHMEHILRQMMAILAFLSHRKAHLICTQAGTELELHHVLHQVINTHHRGQLQFERATLSPGCVIKSRLSCGLFLPKVANSLIATEVCHV